MDESATVPLVIWPDVPFTLPECELVLPSPPKESDRPLFALLLSKEVAAEATFTPGTFSFSLETDLVAVGLVISSATGISSPGASALDPPMPAAPLFFFTFFLLGSDMLPLAEAAWLGAEAGSGRFWGLFVGLARFKGAVIFPEAGRRGLATVGLCLGGSSRSSTSGSSLFACNLLRKKF